MVSLLENLKSNPADWVMVAITIVSAIIAVIACVYSRKSYLLSTEQMEEMKRQFEDTQKLNTMPNLLVKSIPDTPNRNGFDYVCIYENDPLYTEPLKLDVCCQITNVGNGIAKDVSYKWAHKEHSNPQHISSLSVNDARVIHVHFEANPFGNNINTPTVIIQYRDISDRIYEQKVYFRLDIRQKSITLMNISMEAPKEI